MSDVYLLKFNNYFNRLYKSKTALGDYLQADILLDTFNNVNFVEGDGIDTSYICNTSQSPDYIVVANGNIIMSRWYVIEKRILRNGQYKFNLHRDVIADYYNAIVNAPCFIEKATLTPGDPLIFNQEDMTVNQIKTSETLLKDETGSAWVVGYIPKDAFPDGATILADAILDNAADITVDNIQNWEYYPYQTTDFVGQIEKYNVIGRVLLEEQFTSVALKIYRDIRFGLNQAGDYLNISSEEYVKNKPTENLSGLECIEPSKEQHNRDAEYAIKYGCPQKWAKGDARVRISLELRNFVGGHSLIDSIKLTSLNGKIIYDSSSKLYSRIVVEKATNNAAVDIKTSNIPTLFEFLDTNLTRTVTYTGKTYTITGTATDNAYKAEYAYETYRIKLEQVPQQVSATISKPAARYHLEDQPYDMFAIPYSDDLVIKKLGTTLFTANKSLAVNVAVQIAAATGSANVYDVQLLPYCPVRYCIKDDGSFDIGDARVDYVKNKDGANIGVILWATISSFTFDIAHVITVSDVKVDNQCDMYRLTSPNYNGQFEFSAAKNGGVTSFNVDCSYKPFNPYIHVNPNFGRLYGQDFNDARGLICGGDFSLPQLSNAWANYQLNNKNYQAIFDRQIQNMEVNNKVQRTREITSAALGSVQGLLTGAVSGGMTGGVGGAIVGGIAGAAASAGAGAADVILADKLREETLDYTRDMYGYNLGNIQALPTSISKTSAFTYNNKIFPILEYYTCTEEERQAFKDKIKYNGMTVMRIGKIIDYLFQTSEERQYIKARLIRLEDVGDDYHMLRSIDEELNRGMYF